MNKVEASFRDRNGYCYEDNGVVYRKVNLSYKENYDLLFNSGLYKELTDKNYLVAHEESENSIAENNTYKIIKPEQIPLITYPYEWSFSQLKDAALLTLKIQHIALKYNMNLKDASAYNVQFLRGKPVFIDTLSFEKYKENEPWVAYDQFCRHFLAPLVLMAYTDIRCNLILKNYIDGIPLDYAEKMLPLKAKMKPLIYMNICLQAKYQKKYESSDTNFRENAKIAKDKLMLMNQQLQDLVNSLQFPGPETEWGEYYTFTNYNDKAFESKKSIINNFIDLISPNTLWDLGANNGLFTRIASKKNILSWAFDIDPTACEKNYNQVKHEKEAFITPVLFDLTNPSPSIGFANKERLNLASRNKPDMVMALALIHHIAISNNVPFDKIAEFFSSLSENLIIEFVPKEDSKVQKLLMTREDIFDDYNQDCFENSFSKYYELIKKEPVQESLRIIYLFRRIENR